MVATEKTAVFAGAWTVFGLVPFDSYMDSHGSLSVARSNILWLGMLALFVLIPIYFFVLGTDEQPFGRLWFLDQEKRARQRVVVRRMVAWFLSAAIFGTLWSLIWMTISRLVLR